MTDTHHGPLLHEKDGYRIIDCRTCGFAHALPLPTPEALERTYREQYYAEEKPQYLEHQAEDRAWLDLVNAERAALLARHWQAPGKTVLDVGCGGGFFLNACREAGFAVHGVEPSRQAAAHARDVFGLPVSEGFLDDALASTLPRFGAVHASEVLEHLPDPAGMLRRIHDLLVPDGLVLLSLPNEGNPLQEAARQTLDLPPWWVAPPHHLNYFTVDSITALLWRTGFSPLRTLASFPMEFFLLMGENYVGNAQLGRACHAKRKAFELALEAAGCSELKNRLYEAMASLGIGRTVVVLARRREGEE
jgi:2-polyprenyl-3-methyl-5-hydroxy-6-metoxy-1,4-benzoquinol methylase